MVFHSGTKVLVRQAGGGESAAPVFSAPAFWGLGRWGPGLPKNQLPDQKLLKQQAPIRGFDRSVCTAPPYP
jgi:hypothetical protein